jgi:hypothetical protein
MTAVAIGKKSGILCMNNMAVQDTDSFKQKMMLRDNIMGALSLDPIKLMAEDKQSKKLKDIFTGAESCMTCIPIHIDKSRAFDQE